MMTTTDNGMPVWKNIITPLIGADRVRKRPAVVFGSVGEKGALEAVKTLIAVLLREAVLGHSNNLKVELFEDNAMRVSSFDRGLKLDEELVDGKPSWQNLFCELPFFSRDYSENAPSAHQDFLFGNGEMISGCAPDIECAFDLCCVQYVSEYMTVSSMRDGACKTASFEKDSPSAELEIVPASASTETVIEFKLDSEVFGEYKLSASDIDAFLKEQEKQIAGLSCELIVE